MNAVAPILYKAGIAFLVAVSSTLLVSHNLLQREQRQSKSPFHLRVHVPSRLRAPLTNRNIYKTI